MFDIAPTELLLCAVVALIVIGPKDLPRALRTLGQWVGRAKGVARHFRSGIDEMIRQAELDEMQKKWAEENARIMREHPMPAETAAAAGDAAEAAGASDPEADFDRDILPRDGVAGDGGGMADAAGGASGEPPVPDADEGVKPVAPGAPVSGASGASAARACSGDAPGWAKPPAPGVPAGPSGEGA
jgi:sec-independent protein translocase protein TatB